MLKIDVKNHLFTVRRKQRFNRAYMIGYAAIEDFHGTLLRVIPNSDHLRDDYDIGIMKVEYKVAKHTDKLTQFETKINT